MGTTTTTRTSILIVLLGAVLGLLATLLLYNHLIGLGFSLYSVILVGALLAFGGVNGIQPPRATLLLLVPIGFFDAMLTIRAEESLSMMNLTVGIGLSLLLIHFFRGGNLAAQGVFEYPIKALTSSLEVWVAPLGTLDGARRWLGEQKGKWGALAPVARGLVITVPLVLIFVVLLSAADEVFSRLVARILGGLIPNNVYDIVMQATFAGVFGWLAIGGLAAALVERKVKRALPDASTAGSSSAAELAATLLDNKAKRETGDHYNPASSAAGLPKGTFQPLFRLGFTEAIMALGGVCAVFVAFVVIQFVYLFGGQHNIANYSYADYVHRGFVELVAVAVLTLVVVFTLNGTTDRSKGLRENLFRGLSTLLVALTSVILVSAWQRMHLYELTYGFTALRLQIYVFILWLGILFAGFTLSLYWHPRAINVFGVCSLCALIGFAATLDTLNPEAFVTAQNIRRGDIDPDYLSTLSIEAAPALASLVDAPEPGLRAVIQHTLYWQLERLDAQTRAADWRDFNMARANALAALNPMRAKLLAGEAGNRLRALLKLADFQIFLKKGMTVRAVERQFGLPTRYNWARGYADASTPYELSYVLEENSQLNLFFNTETGLDRACNQNGNVDIECLTLP